jgi:excisionase family DNA binding protein
MQGKKLDCAQVNKLAYRINEAREVSGLGRSSIYELIGDGRLSSVKVGGRRLILHEDLEALLKSSTTTVARPTPHSATNARATSVAESRELTPPAWERWERERRLAWSTAADAGLKARPS